MVVPMYTPLSRTDKAFLDFPGLLFGLVGQPSGRLLCADYYYLAIIPLRIKYLFKYGGAARKPTGCKCSTNL